MASITTKTERDSLPTHVDNCERRYLAIGHRLRRLEYLLIGLLLLAASDNDRLFQLFGVLFK